MVPPLFGIQGPWPLFSSTYRLLSGHPFWSTGCVGQRARILLPDPATGCPVHIWHSTNIDGSELKQHEGAFGTQLLPAFAFIEEKERPLPEAGGWGGQRNRDGEARCPCSHYSRQRLHHWLCPWGTFSATGNWPPLLSH